MTTATQIALQDYAEPRKQRTLTAQVNNYTLVLLDAGKTVTMTKGTAVTLTVPTNASVAFPVGTQIKVENLGAGLLTIAGAAPPTINGKLTVRQYDSIVLEKTATNTWLVIRQGLSPEGDTMTGDLAVTGVAISDTDGTGVFTGAAQSTDPAAVAGFGQYTWRKLAKAVRPWFRPDYGRYHPLGRADWSRQMQVITPQSAAALRQAGVGGSGTITGTPTHAATADGYMTTFPSSGGAGAGSGYVGTSVFLRGASSTQLHGGFEYHSRHYFPDASYNNTGASTGSRIHIGLGSAVFATWMGTDYGTTAAQNAMFAREHVNGAATDTNWQFVTSSGGGRTVGDTGMPFTAQHVYDFHIECKPNDSTVYWRIDDLTAATTASGSATGTLPDTATAMATCCGVWSIDAVVRSMNMAWMSTETL